MPTASSSPPPLPREEEAPRLALVPKPSPTVKEAWELLLEEKPSSRRKKLKSIWRAQLAPVLEGVTVAELAARKLTTWEAWHIEEGYAPKTTMDAFMSLQEAVRGVLTGVEDLPWRIAGGRYWRPRRAPVALAVPAACCTVAEVEQLAHAGLEEDRLRRAGAHGVAYANRLVDLGLRVLVTLFLGLRNGELAALGWDDLELWTTPPEARVCHRAGDQWRTHHPAWERPREMPKGHKTRKIAIHPTALLALLAQKEQLEERGWFRPDGPVFPSHEGNKWAGTWRNNKNGIKPEEMRRLARVAGLPFPDEWVTHSLRHSFATVEHAAGADLRTIQMRGGWSSLRILENYIHARTRGLPLSAIPELAVTFDRAHDTEPCPPPDAEE